ncbi:MAG: hypothetical protein DWQ35_07515 [Planctomycetota bacterium]|nr:MAG: hypothetical protein DWQ35_07515 [Planctomycetota bacterium]REK30180.1 MAG: hypothetical protein DWQ42_02035 [Planctomycetota bacterium]REK43293.1 MAG: hypothetical protein DWQ46_11760 [Planctomycetota bacterium]
MSGIDRAFIRAYGGDPQRRGRPKAGVTRRIDGAHGTASNAASAASQATPLPPARSSAPPPRSLAASQPFAAPPTSYFTEAAHDNLRPPHWPAGPAAAATAASAIQPLPPYSRPAYEVDDLAWPDVCRTLVTRCGSELATTTKTLVDHSRAGARVVYVSGVHGGEGVTTITLCLAQRLASVGLKVALVDAHFERPALAAAVGISPAAGWEDIAREGHGIGEVMIQSQAEHVALLPLRGVVTQPHVLVNDLYWPATLTTLAAHYHCVIIDGPPWVSAAANTILSLGDHASLDAAIFVTGTANDSLYELSLATGQFAGVGAEVLGVIENQCEAAATPALRVPSAARIA